MKKINERAPQEALLDIIFPIGCIIESDPTGLDGAPVLDTAEKVHDWYGIGTWESYADGRVLQGVSSSYTIGTTGGEEKHTLTVPEMPNHSHTTGTNADGYWRYGGEASNIQNGSGTWARFSRSVSPEGGNQPHNNMQPYKVVYRWRRIS